MFKSDKSDIFEDWCGFLESVPFLAISVGFDDRTELGNSKVVASKSVGPLADSQVLLVKSLVFEAFEAPVAGPRK